MLLCYSHSQAHRTRIVKGRRARYIFAHEHDIRNQQRPKTTIFTNFTFNTCCVWSHQLDISFWAPGYAHVKLRYQALSTFTIAMLTYGISQGSRGWLLRVHTYSCTRWSAHMAATYCDSTSNWLHCVQVEIELPPYHTRSIWHAERHGGLRPDRKLW